MSRTGSHAQRSGAGVNNAAMPASAQNAKATGRWRYTAERRTAMVPARGKRYQSAPHYQSVGANTSAMSMGCKCSAVTRTGRRTSFIPKDSGLSSCEPKWSDFAEFRPLATTPPTTSNEMMTARTYCAQLQDAFVPRGVR